MTILSYTSRGTWIFMSTQDTGTINIHSPMAHSYPRVLMQPSMGTLNSPSSRVVKDSTPSRRRILRYINFGIGESSPILFLDMMNLHLIIFEAFWILNELFYYFLYFKVNLDPEKNKQTNKSAWRIFTQLYICGGESWPNYLGNDVNWWWILT